ncbi:MAG: hypothetical protein GEU81_11530 [Nitriliruptorales bacterium]|nr:hypothetical protein [Nitriliruptorales bacterium]
MRKTVRLFSEVGPEERLGRAVALLPGSAQRALADAAEREDLPLVAGSWQDGEGGCLVANVIRAIGAAEDGDGQATLDLRILELMPELSSRDLNRLIVAWDEAAAQEGRRSDPALRRLLRGGLAWAGVGRDKDGRPGTSIPLPLRWQGSEGELDLLLLAITDEGQRAPVVR